MKSPTWSTLLSHNASLFRRATEPLREQHRPPAGAGSWLMGLVMAADGPRRYYLFRPAGVRFGERLPLLVMLHGCHQDARSFADSTRMNGLAGRERFLVLGLALEDACAHDRARLLAGLPAPTRLAWRVVGRGRYRATVVRLRGAPPAR